MKIKYRLVTGLHTFMKVFSRTCFLFCADIIRTLVLLYFYEHVTPPGFCSFCCYLFYGHITPPGFSP
jgi:hypothetical protein